MELILDAFYWIKAKKTTYNYGCGIESGNITIGQYCGESNWTNGLNLFKIIGADGTFDSDDWEVIEKVKYMDNHSGNVEFVD